MRFLVAFLVLGLGGSGLAGCEAARTPEAREQGQAQGGAQGETLRRGEAAGVPYLELVRGAKSADERLPMVVFIHGRGDRPHPGWVEGLSVRARFIFPQAPLPYGDGFSWFGFDSRNADTETLARSIAESADRLSRGLSELSRSRPTLGKPIVAGFSQGGMLSFALALLHPQAISFALPISGLLPSRLWETWAPGATAHPPIRAMHGRADDIVPFAPTEQMVGTLRARGLDIELRAYAGVYHQITPEMRAQMHAWVREALSRVAPRPPG